MSLRKKTKSSDLLLPAVCPQRPPILVGNGIPKSRSGSSTTKVYKSVITGNYTPLVGSPSKRQRSRSPTKRHAVLHDSFLSETARFDGISSTLLDSESENVGKIMNEATVAASDARESVAIEDNVIYRVQSTDQPAVQCVESLPARHGQTPPEQSTDFSRWGLPNRVVESYRKTGITTMFPWQSECLNQGKVLDGGSLVYSAPTSAGKTLVAEILLLKRVVETQKKGLFIFPYVALAREKMLNLQRIFNGSGIRIGGFMGHMHPPGGLAMLDVAVCTIEKANSLINRLIMDKKLDQLSVIVVDELHMVGDYSRGHLIELFLSKVRHFNKLHMESDEFDEEEKLKNSVQIIGMSATLPNLELVAKWLDASLYITDFRPVPLYENVKLGTVIYDRKWQKVRDVTIIPSVKNDPDHVISLCFETARAGHGVLVFCPYKKWCENLATNIAVEFASLLTLSSEDRDNVAGVVAQLRESPAGLDSVLEKTVPFGVAFHHAGLTMDEKDIIEAGFRKCCIRVLVATTTLSSGVNLPARRVIIRSPLVVNGVLDILTYSQMAGRAGRKGVDTEGESILICKDIEKIKVSDLLGSSLKPVMSCLTSSSSGEVSSSMLRAVLDAVANGATQSVKAVADFLDSTLFSVGLETGSSQRLARKAVDTLASREFIIIAVNKEDIAPSQLGNAVVWSGLPIETGFAVFRELERARLHLNLESELHILYLVTPLNLTDQVSHLDWYRYLKLWEALPKPWKRVGELVGVDEKLLASALQGQRNQSDRTVVCLRRFYCALMLNELVHEVPLSIVSRKYDVNKGVLQSLQQGAATYSGVVTIFCRELGWGNMSLLVEQFQSRLMFGVQRELMELIRIEYLTAHQARCLYNNGYPNLAKLATAEHAPIQDILLKTAPFNSNSAHILDGKVHGKKILLNKMDPMAEDEAAVLIIREARRLLEDDMAALGFRLVETKPSATAGRLLDASSQEPVSSVRENTKAQNVAKFAELQSTQMEVDEPPLDPAFPVADDVMSSQLTQPAGKSNDRSASTSPGKNYPDTSQRQLMNSPARIESSDTEDDFVTPTKLRSVSTFDEYVVSSFSSVKNYLASPALPTVSPGDTIRIQSALKANNKSDRGVTGESAQQTPLYQPKSPHSKGLTPVLFVTPGLKRKSSSSSESVDEPPVKRGADDTISFDMDMKINFEDDFAALAVASQRCLDQVRATPSPPLPSAAPEEPTGDFKIVTVSESHSTFSRFLNDWRKQATFGLTVACEKIGIEAAVRIGPPRPGGGQKKVFTGIPVPSLGCTIVGTAVSWNNKTAYYVSLSDKPKSSMDLDSVSDPTFTVDARISALRTALVDLSGKSVIMYDLKRQLHMLSVGLGMPVFGAKFCDPKVASWLLDMGSDDRTMQMFVAKECPALLSLLEDCKAYRGTGSLGGAINLAASARVRSSIDAVISRFLFEKLSLTLKFHKLYDFFETVEMPVLISLIVMELNGFGFCAEESHRVEQSIQEQLDLIERRVFDLTGRKFQLSSSEAVGQELFVNLRLPPPPESIHSRIVRGKTKSYYSTNEKVLMKIRNLHPLPLLVLEHRRLQGALSKSVHPIQNLAVASKALHMDRIHGSCFTATVTGRVSMADPSMQNIPKDFEIDAWVELTQSQGKASKLKKISQNRMTISLRSSFLPFTGGVLLSADYSQLELRIMAHLAQDEKLIQALSDGGDVFNMIASQWKKIGIDKVSPDERQQAKKICYGIIYGMGTKALAEQLDVPDDAAAKFIDTFKSTYPDVDRFIKATTERCRRAGYVATVSGCRRYLASIDNVKSDLRAQAERQAVNTTVQGSAANLAKTAMVKIDRELREMFPNALPHQLRNRSKEPITPRGAYLVLQLHDEFIYEVHVMDLARVAEVVERHMRTALSLRVPLRVNLRTGPNWGALTEYKLNGPR